jgi:hyperosmotically inducible periplasmic protein
MSKKTISGTVLWLILAGCEAAWPMGSRTQIQAVNQPGSEAYLQSQVRHQLVMLPYYSIFDNLEYRVDGDTVTLMGETVRPTLKSDAAGAVKRIEGVQKVVNNIKVLPLSLFDDRIRLAEYRAIYGYPALNRYALQAVGPIHIIVENGHVTLKGVVANEMDKNLANLRANGVPGVFSVTNELQVES